MYIFKKHFIRTLFSHNLGYLAKLSKMTTNEPAKVNPNDNPKEKPKRPIIIPKHGKKSKKKDIGICHLHFRMSVKTLTSSSTVVLADLFKRKMTLEINFPLNKEFYVEYDESKHSAEFNKYLKFDDAVPQKVRDRVTHIVKKYWSCFREGGLTIPIVGYEMVIDTGSSPPVNSKKLHYGEHESPIMHNTIDALQKTGFIIEDKISPWNSNIVLAPKPHQEHTTDIDKFIWRFLHQLCSSEFGNTYHKLPDTSM